jgi:hypothetical protein
MTKLNNWLIDLSLTALLAFAIGIGVGGLCLTTMDHVSDVDAVPASLHLSAEVL